jgi:hypothetical protein
MTRKKHTYRYILAVRTSPYSNRSALPGYVYKLSRDDGKSVYVSRKRLRQLEDEGRLADEKTASPRPPGPENPSDPAWQDYMDKDNGILAAMEAREWRKKHGIRNQADIADQKAIADYWAKNPERKAAEIKRMKKLREERKEKSK